MSCGREGVFTAVMLGLGPTLRRQAEEAGYSKPQAAMAGALGGGVIVASLSHPMYTIKTCQPVWKSSSEFSHPEHNCERPSSTSTPSSRRSYVNNIASMAWNLHAIEQMQSQDNCRVDGWVP